ncbi:hypothetical protein ACOSP7_010697 [Xanthoceras sorbifolium]
MVVGDKNIKFFHASASVRKKKNEILKIVDEFGACHGDEDGILRTVSKFFSSLFKSNSPSNEDLEAATCKIHRKINDEMLGILSEYFTVEEVKAAVFSLGLLKAPGPNGF